MYIHSGVKDIKALVSWK